MEGAIYWYRLPEREVAPLKGVPVVAGGAVVGGGAFVAGPPTGIVRPEKHCSDYVLSRSEKKIKTKLSKIT